MNKEQQKFWKILSYPYPTRKDCNNCVHGIRISKHHYSCKIHQMAWCSCAWYMKPTPNPWQSYWKWKYE